MQKQNAKSSTGLTTVLLVVFVVLKLTGNITWSWWWVLSPLWIVLALCALLCAFIGLFFIIARLAK